MKPFGCQDKKTPGRRKNKSKYSESGLYLACRRNKDMCSSAVTRQDSRKGNKQSLILCKLFDS